VPEQSPEIEAAGVKQQPFQNIAVASQVSPAHPSGLVHVREGAFDTFATQSL
jgi:hypothetical protein